MPAGANNEPVLIGAHVPKELASKVALAGLALGQSRAEFIRSAVTAALDRHVSPSLTRRLALRLVSEWSALRASSDTTLSLIDFRKQTTSRLVDAGVALPDIREALALFDEELG